MTVATKSERPRVESLTREQRAATGAAEGSQIGQIEAVAGGIPCAGGTQRIASRIGAGRAAEIVFTAAVLPPETLAARGLIDQVVLADRLTEEGRAFARGFASGPTLTHATTKRVLRAWRSGRVATAGRVTHAEGPAVMLARTGRTASRACSATAGATPPSTTADQVAR